MNEEAKMEGWIVTLLGFVLWTAFIWSIGRWVGWARCFTTAYNRGWEDRERVERYIDRRKEDELQEMAGVTHGG